MLRNRQCEESMAAVNGSGREVRAVLGRYGLALMAAVFLGGCATPNVLPGGLDQIATSKSSDELAAVGPPLKVIIGFPATFDAEARKILQEAKERVLVDKETGGWSQETWLKQELRMKESLNYVVSRSTLLAHELATELTGRLPADSVAVVPYRVSATGGRLTKSYAGVDVPAALHVDILAHADPRERQAGSPNFGPYIAALVDIRGEPMAAPKTGGVLAAPSQLPISLGRPPEQTPSILDAFVIAASNPKPQKAFEFSNHVPPEEGKVVGVPLVEYSIPGSDWDAYLAGIPEGKRTPLAKPYFAAMANLVVWSLAAQDSRMVAADAQARYVAIFDSDLANGRGGPETPMKLEAIALFQQTEAALLSRISLASLDNLMKSDFGEGLRSSIAEQRAAVTREQVQAATMMVATIATLGMAAPVAYAVQNALLLQAIAAGNQYGAEYQELADFAAASLGTVTIEFAGQTEAVSASSLQELREKLKGLYAKRFPVQ